MNKLKILQLALTTGLLSTIYYLLPANSYAQQDFSLTTSPLPVNLTTTPGKTVSTDLRVKNNTNTSQDLKVNLYKFRVNANSEVALAEREPTDSYFDWVSFSPASFTADAGEWNTVKMTINVPKEAALGYYYAVGFAPAKAAKPTPGSATLQGQVISFVLLDVDVPGAKRELKVTSFKSAKSVYEFLPASFTVTVKNTGNIHMVPTGDIFINRGGKSLAALPINPGQNNILPNSSRTFTVEWKDGFPVYTPKTRADGNPVIDPKTSTVEKELKWDLSQASKLRIGPYSAKLLLVYDDGTRDVPVEGNLSFWAVPWRVLGVFLIVFLLAGVGFWTTGRKIFGRVKGKGKKGE